MSVPRCRALQAAVALVVLLAGCVGGFDGGSTVTTPADTPAGATTTGSGVRQATPTGDPAAVTYTVDREHVEYLESEDAIRYVAAWRAPENVTTAEGSPPARTPIYETVSFAEWAETECANAGAIRMTDVLESRLDQPVGNVSAGITRWNGSVAIFVTHRTLYGRNGTVLSKPSVSFDRLVAVTPWRMTVTLTIENRTTTCEVPVVVEAVRVQQS